MRAGDLVHHKPSNERWILAVNPERGRVRWLGWPPGDAAEGDCELILKCSDDAHRVMLEKVAKVKCPHYDPRSQIAQDQLLDLNEGHLGMHI